MKGKERKSVLLQHQNLYKTYQNRITYVLRDKISKKVRISAYLFRYLIAIIFFERHRGAKHISLFCKAVTKRKWRDDGAQGCSRSLKGEGRLRRMIAIMHIKRDRHKKRGKIAT